MRVALVLALLAACGNEPSEGFPINPGGPGGTGSSFMPDAFVPQDVGTTITGKVCFIQVNPQNLVTCATTAADGFTVTLGAQATLTADDGSFTIMRPASTTGLVWSVTRADTVPSAIVFGTTTTLPAIDAGIYNDMVVSTNAPITVGNGALMARITRITSAGSPVVGATLATQPIADSGIFYDGPSSTEWQQIATGPAGVAWAPSIDTGNATLTITAGSAQPTIVVQPVFAGTITFAFVAVP